MRRTWSATSRRVSARRPATAIAMMLSGLRMSCATVAASEPSSARRACSWRSRSRAAICCACSTRAAASATTEPNSSATWRGPGGAASQPAARSPTRRPRACAQARRRRVVRRASSPMRTVDARADAPAQQCEARLGERGRRLARTAAPVRHAGRSSGGDGAARIDQPLGDAADRAVEREAARGHRASPPTQRDSNGSSGVSATTRRAERQQQRPHQRAPRPGVGHEHAVAQDAVDQDHRVQRQAQQRERIDRQVQHRHAVAGRQHEAPQARRRDRRDLAERRPARAQQRGQQHRDAGRRRGSPMRSDAIQPVA